MVVAGSSKEVWWKCPKGADHEWETEVSHRTTKDNPTGCPYCAGKKLSVTNILATVRPEIIGEWHPTKNGDLTPQTVVAGSATKVWWRCPKGPDHEWQATLVSRTKGASGCPFCSGLKVSVTNCLASLFPDVAAEWHPVKNGDLTPPHGGGSLPLEGLVAVSKGPRP
jgi:putative zinc ribbon protein